MKIRSLLIILLAVILIPLTLASDTQRRFKVHVTVKADDSTDVDERLEAFVKRELRALGDVDIVGIDADWTLIFAYNILEITFKDGRKSGSVAIASSLQVQMPKDYIVDEMKKSPLVRGNLRLVVWKHPKAAYCSVDDLHGFAIQDAAGIDKILEPLR